MYLHILAILVPVALSAALPQNPVTQGLPPLNISKAFSTTCGKFEDGAQWIPVNGTREHAGFADGVKLLCQQIYDNPSDTPPAMFGAAANQSKGAKIRDVDPKRVHGGAQITETYSIEKNGETTDSIKKQIWLSDGVPGELGMFIRATKDDDFDTFAAAKDTCEKIVMDAFAKSGFDCFGESRQDTIGGEVVYGEKLSITVKAIKAGTGPGS